MPKLNTSTKVLANGEKRTYYYAWRNGPRIKAEFGTPEFVEEYNYYHKSKTTLAKGSIAWLIQEFMASPEWVKMRPRTQKDHLLMFNIIKQEFGTVSLQKAQAKGQRKIFRFWRDTLGERSHKSADKAMSSLSRLFTWAVDQEEMDKNPVLGIGKLYSANRADKWWQDHDIDRFRSVASPVLRIALLFALDTGQRQGDILNLKWNNYNGTHLTLTQSKTGKTVSILCSDALKATIDSLDKSSTFILLNSHNKPWTSMGFQASWRKAARKAGITDRTFHDLRGTFVVRALRQGLTSEQIAQITGHSLSDLRTLERHYMGFDQQIADNVILMMNQNKS